MPSYQCGICGQTHDELPHDLAYTWPPEYLRVPEGERETRVMGTPDMCVVDNKEFLIRGVLPLPIRDATDDPDPEFRWGVWVLVDKQHYVRYLELWKADTITDPPFRGRLSGGIRGYDNSDLLEVRVELQPDSARPRFYVVSEQHQLGRAQREGIPLAQVHRFIETFMPGRLTQPAKQSVADYFRGKRWPKQSSE